MLGAGFSFRNQRLEHRSAHRSLEQGDAVGSRHGLPLHPSAKRTLFQRGEQRPMAAIRGRPSDERWGGDWHGKSNWALAAGRLQVRASLRSRKYRSVRTSEETGDAEQHNGSRTESGASETADAVRRTFGLLRR
ncbi:uncharacterized protein LOC123318509 [Coccinella septempunctata]|uniref:uncharacterized protein LOC123318509 n=1 Tax=Coccinella septempunctata TaxID=41139 RepID=UPI001D079E25|nr:uncharacterized protein LOC123318509 [Coccinella septempunctata]